MLAHRIPVIDPLGLVDMPVIHEVLPEGESVYTIPGDWNYSVWRPLVCLSDWTWTYDWRGDSPEWWRKQKAGRRYVLYKRSGWFVNGYCSIFRDKTFRYARAHMWWFQNHAVELGSGYRGAYTNVYATCQGSCDNYAHWIFDHLAWLCALPAGLSQQCVAVFPTDRFVDSLAICGIDRVLFLNREHYIWAENLYQWDPIPADWQEPVVLLPLRAFFVQRLKLDERAPAVCGVMKREGPRVSRRLGNLDAWFSRWQREYPAHRWENSTGFRSLRQAGPWFNSLRLFFAAHGAGCVNILFMQRGTAFGEVLPFNINPAAYFSMSRFLGLHHVSYKKPNFHHFSGDTVSELFEFEGATIMQALMAGLGQGATVTPPSPRPT